MSEKDKKIYAWVSPSTINNQEMIVTYKTMSGENINVSVITDNPHDSGTSFKDIQFMGEVEQWVSSVPNPKCNKHFKIM